MRPRLSHDYFVRIILLCRFAFYCFVVFLFVRTTFPAAVCRRNNILLRGQQESRACILRHTRVIRSEVFVVPPAVATDQPHIQRLNNNHYYRIYIGGRSSTRLVAVRRIKPWSAALRVTYVGCGRCGYAPESRDASDIDGHRADIGTVLSRKKRFRLNFHRETD